MAMLNNAQRLHRSAVGKYRSISQTHAMALLLAHGTHEPALTNTIRRHRASYRPTRISEWRLTRRYRLANPKGRRYEEGAGGVQEQFYAERPTNYGGYTALRDR